MESKQYRGGIGSHILATPTALRYFYVPPKTAAVLIGLAWFNVWHHWKVQAEHGYQDMWCPCTPIHLGCRVCLLHSTFIRQYLQGESLHVLWCGAVNLCVTGVLWVSCCGGRQDNDSDLANVCMDPVIEVWRPILDLVLYLVRLAETVVASDVCRTVSALPQEVLKGVTNQSKTSWISVKEYSASFQTQDTYYTPRWSAVRHTSKQGYA